MNKFLPVLFVSLSFCFVINGQTAPSSTITTPEAKPTPETADTKKTKRPPVFRANKNQIKQVQRLLKEKSLYIGESTGKLDLDTRNSVKSFQKETGLTETGTLNRATLEKMGIELTEKQKLIPVTPDQYSSNTTTVKRQKQIYFNIKTTPTTSDEPKPKKVIFRATKEQITEAQKILKAKSIYSGEETGKLDDATRDGLKKFQEANGIKVTGTLNKLTLETMGIALTEKQLAQ